MPSRPREHDQETESRRKFATLLPPSWTDRIIVEDYGVDLEVEIFSEGRATGLTFRVQLKATDKSPKRGRISRGDIKRSTLNYWKSLDTPVLVVLYSTPAQVFYGRWAHSYDDYYGKSADSKTITFAFRPNDLLDSTFIDSIPRQLAWIRSANRRSLQWPLPVTVHCEEAVHGHSRDRIEAAFRRAIERTSGVLSLSSGGEFLATNVTLSNETIVAVLPTHLRSFTAHLERIEYASERGFEGLVADAMILIADSLAHIGETEAASRIIRNHKDQSRAFDVPLIRKRIFDFMLESSDSKAYAVVSDWIDSNNPNHRDFAEAALVDIFVNQSPHGMTRAEDVEMLERLKRRAQIERNAGRQSKSATTFYNVAEILRSNGQWDLALESFDLALDSDMSYRKRGYFWRSRASVNFQLGRLESAEADYRKAIECGGSPESAFLLSDIQMRRGRYKDAQALDFESLEVHDYYKLGIRVHRRVLDVIVETTGLSSQERKPVPREIMDAISRDITQAEVSRYLSEYDALDGRIWQLRGYCAGKDDDLQLATAAYLVAAMLEVDSAELWAMAACLAAESNYPDADLDDICDCALKNCETEFLDEVERVCTNDGPLGALGVSIRDRVYSRARMDRPRWPKVVRLLGNDGEYITLGLD